MNRTSREILQLLRVHGRISRAQLAKELGLTRMAISTTVDSLLKSGILEPVGMETPISRGRPSEIFQITGKRLYCLGIAINVFSIDMVILDWFNNTVAFKRIENLFRQQRDQPDSATEEVLAILSDMMTNAGISSVNGGAIAFSADAHDETGRRIVAANDFLSVEQANHFLERLRDRWDIPIWLERDVDASLLAERWAATDLPSHPNLFYVNDRLGFAMILDGRPWRGPAAAPRWLGRVQIDPKGPAIPGFLPGSMNNGSIISILERREGFPVGCRPALSPPVSHAEFQEIFRLYERNDSDIVLQLQDSFRQIGMIVRNLVALFSFDAVILDGWTPLILNDGVAILQQVIAELSGPPGWPKTVVRAANLGEPQQAIGAAISSIDHVLASRKIQISTMTGAKKRSARRSRKF